MWPARDALRRRWRAASLGRTRDEARRTTMVEEDSLAEERIFRGVILDVDGTLIDSNDAHAAAWVDALSEAGIDVPFERVRRLIGKGGDKLLPEVSGIQVDSPEGKRLSER